MDLWVFFYSYTTGVTMNPKRHIPDTSWSTDAPLETIPEPTRLLPTAL